MLRLLILLLFFAVSGCASKNNVAEKKADAIPDFSLPPSRENNLPVIGFTCYAGGSKSPIVKEFTDYLKEKNYQSIREKLYRNKPEEICLATFSCQSLSKEKSIKLTKAELSQIELNKNKTDTVAVCSGCTYFKSLTVKELINDSTSGFLTEANWWFKEAFHP